MKISNEAKALGFLLLLLCASFFLSGYWHAFSINSIPIISFSLESFDTKAYSGGEACFTAAVTPSFLRIESTQHLSAEVNGKGAAADIISFYKEPVKKKYCFSSGLLKEGDNTVFVFLGNQKLFYHATLEGGAQPEESYGLRLLDINAGAVGFRFDSAGMRSYEPIGIFVNGKLDHYVYPKEGGMVFSERFSAPPGKNIVEVRFREKSVSAETDVPGKNAVPVPLGFLLVVFCIACLALTVFANQGFFGKFALSMAFFLAIVTVAGFALNALKLLSLYSFLFVVVAASAAIGFAFRKNCRLSFGKFSPLGLHPLFYVVILVALGVPLLFHVFSFSQFSYWNVFYERHAETLAESFSQPLFDQYSYFGRGVSFIPGYFFLDAGLGWISGLSGTALFAMLMLFGNILLLLSVFCLGDSIGLSKPKSALLFILLCLENFIGGAIVISPRHAISFSLFLAGMAVLIKKGNPIVAGALIGIAAFVQAPMLAAFPVLYAIAAKKPDWKRLAKTLAVAGALFGLFYIPNAINFGIFSQAESQNWGYLIDYNFYSLFLDIGPLVVFFLLISLPDLLRRKARLDGYAAKLLAAAIAGLLFQVYISYRWNIFNAVNIGILLAYLIPDRALHEAGSSRYIAVIMLLAVAAIGGSANTLSISTYSSTAYDFISRNTGSSARLLPDPLFGHDIAYFCKRQVLADLAVEYADEKKLDAAYEFLVNKDSKVLAEYGIDYTINQADMINRKAFGNSTSESEIEYPALNKVFTNGFLFVHSVPQGLQK